MLAAAAATLLIIDRDPAGGPGTRGGAVPADVSRRTGEVVDSLFRRYGIERQTVRTWQVKVRGSDFSRIEQRITVQPEFVALNFNRDLSKEVAVFGAHVVATERTAENVVTLHVVAGGTTYRSLEFVVAAAK